MLALLPYLVLALDAVLDLDITRSLSFSYVVFKWFWVPDKPKQISPLHFSTLAEKICLEISCFSFIKAAVIKQEHVIILCRCFQREDICLRCAKLFWTLLAGPALNLSSAVSEINSFGR